MQDADIQVQNAQEIKPALPLRHDTILGVCEGIGEDLGFNPNWLRLAFAASFYFNPAMVVGAYLALGAVVAVTRWIYPKPQAAAAPQPEAVAADAVLEHSAEQPAEDRVPIAA